MMNYLSLVDDMLKAAKEGSGEPPILDLREVMHIDLAFEHFVMKMTKRNDGSCSFMIMEIDKDVDIDIIDDSLLTITPR